MREVAIQNPQHYFWVCNGAVLKSLGDLFEEMKVIDDNSFRHHVNESNNDFSNWVGEIIGDKRLANKIRASQTREEIVLALERKIKSGRGASKRPNKKDILNQIKGEFGSE